jgi:hypothetical protein
MLWFKLIDYIQSAFTADDLIVGTDFFNACTHLHADLLLSETTHCLYLITC